MATRTQRQNPQRQNAQRQNAQRGSNGARRKKHDDGTGLMPVLAKAVREVENAVQRRRVTATTRAKSPSVA